MVESRLTMPSLGSHPPSLVPTDTGNGMPATEPFISLRLQKFISNFAQPESDLRIFPDLISRPWFEPAEFEITCALEEAHPAIREEILGLDAEVFHEESEPIERKGKWDVFLLLEGGRKNEENCGRCPTVSSLIDRFADITTDAGLVYISRMRAGTHIAAHRGPTNMRLRCHLGVQVPQGDCRIRVDRQTGSWTEGKSIVFDDYFEHEAWNHTAFDRTVLIVDIWHPSLTLQEREVLKGLKRYVNKHAEGMCRYWEANFNRRVSVMQDYY